jgi:hypothetical protein
MENFNEDLELIEFAFSRKEFKRGDRIYSPELGLHCVIYENHPFVPDSWIVQYEKNNKKHNHTLHRDNILRCQS